MAQWIKGLTDRLDNQSESHQDLHSGRKEEIPISY